MDRLPLGSYPTPVEPLEALSTKDVSLWIKRDDLTSDVYGGNKVRKLEAILAHARKTGATRLLTFGAAGSHHVLATAVFGRAAGFDVDAVIFPQPASPHARDNLRADLALGTHTHVVASPFVAPLALLAEWTKGAYFVAGGGSSLEGTLGYVAAARELAAQVRAGQMPEPDEIVVALGSGGTAAGLCAGLALEGMHTRVVGVCVVDPPWPFARFARWLAHRAVAAAGGGVERSEIDRRLVVDASYLGRGYGFPSEAGARATERAQSAGVALDPTYTAKTFAAVLDRVAHAGAKTLLYWHTLSSAPMQPLLQGAVPLDERHARLFR